MKKKFRLPVGELFKFFNLLDIDDNDTVDINRYLAIKNQYNKYKRINSLIKKQGQVNIYKFEDDINIKCDEKHLVRCNNRFICIKDADTVDTIYGNKKKMGAISGTIKDVYDFSIDSPHEYITSNGVICHNTSLAKLLVKNIDCDFMYVNASDKGNIDFLRNEIIPFATSIGFKDRKIIILDEADYLSFGGMGGSQQALRNTMEASSRNTRFILTCNYVEKIIDPIKSRCDVYHITPPSRKEVAVLLTKILNKEQVEYDVSDLAVVVNSTYPDMRRAINLIQRQSINGKLKISKQSIIESNYMLKIAEELKSNKEPKEKFKSIRKIISDSKVRDFEDLYRFLFDNVDDYAKGNIASVILEIAETQFQSTFVVDKEIAVTSLLVKLIRTINEK